MKRLQQLLLVPYTFLLNHSSFFAVALTLSALLLTAVTLPYGNFTDEHEQLTGGWLITQGWLPYRDFFSHHGPLPLYFSAAWMSLPHWLNTLLWLRVGQFMTIIALWLSVWKICRPHHRLFIALFLLMSALATPLFNLQMAVSSTLTFHLLMAQAVLLFNWLRHHRPSPRTLLWFLGLSSILTLWTSPAALLPEIGIWSTVAIVSFQRGQLHTFFQFKLAAKLLLLFLIVPLFFLFQHSFTAFRWSLFTYNTEFYYPLRLAENNYEKEYGLLYRLTTQFSTTVWQESSQAITATITLGRSIWGAKQLLSSFSLHGLTSYFSVIFTEWWHVINQPKTVLYAAFILTTILFLFKKPLFGLWYLLMGMLFTFRDNEVFQLNVFFGWTILGLCLQLIQHSTEKRKRVFVPLMTLGLFIIILSLHYLQFWQWKQPLFSSTLQARKPIIEKYSAQSLQVLDGNLADYWLTKKFPANKYYFYHPWLHQTPAIQEEMLHTLAESKPEVVVVSEELYRYAPELKDVLEKNYSTSREDEFVLLRRKMEE